MHNQINILATGHIYGTKLSSKSKKDGFPEFQDTRREGLFFIHVERLMLLTQRN